MMADGVPQCRSARVGSRIMALLVGRHWQLLPGRSHVLIRQLPSSRAARLLTAARAAAFTLGAQLIYMIMPVQTITWS